MDDKPYMRNFVNLVIWQMKFPNLFFIENKIGDFQELIMSDFPESRIQYQNQINFEQSVSNISISNQEGKDIANKSWIFESSDKMKITVSYDTLTIELPTYHSYTQGSLALRGRIEDVVNKFLECTKISVLKRVGFRYNNNCKLPDELSKESFFEWYNSSYPKDFDFSSVKNFHVGVSF